MSDKCIVTAGMRMPNSYYFDRTLAEVKPKKERATANTLDSSPQVNSILTAVAAELAVSVISSGFKQVKKYIKDRAEDSPVNYDGVSATSVFEIGKETVKNGSYYRAIKINSNLKCVTVIINNKTAIIDSRNVKSSEKVNISGSNKKYYDDFNYRFGPPKSIVFERMRKSGVYINEDPILIFETALQFSDDGSAVKFVPRYFRVFQFEKNQRGVGAKQNRNIALSIALDFPTSGDLNAQVFQQTFLFPSITADTASDFMWINGEGSEYGFGPKWTNGAIGRDEWISFTPGNLSISEDFVESLQSVPKDSVISLKPANLRTKFVVTESASDMAKAMAKFFDDSSVLDDTQNALTDRLGLTNFEDDERKAAYVSSLETRITYLGDKITALNALGDNITESQKKRFS